VRGKARIGREDSICSEGKSGWILYGAWITLGIVKFEASENETGESVLACESKRLLRRRAPVMGDREDGKLTTSHFACLPIPTDS